ncbi:two component transcriptional regulator, LuxR family [Streptomyces sp. WMMB 322]|nr:two component transcriptional regulator, LuxR family [Streptomyces sp. WMMB 322]
MEESTQITVFLLDDHEMIRRGVHEMLSAESGIEVIGEADNAADALKRIPDARPDVALLDVRLPDGSGIEVCRELRSRAPDIACLILTSFTDEEALVHAVLAGASGYVLKGIRGSELQSAVRDAAAGKALIGPDAARRVVERLRRGAGRADVDGDGRLASLSGQERIILDLIGAGMTNRAIGDKLNLPRKRSRTMSRSCSRSSAWNAGPRRPRTSPASGREAAGEPTRAPEPHRWAGWAGRVTRGCRTGPADC